MNPKPIDLGTLRLIIAGQVQTDSSFPLPPDAETVLGRDPNCEIVLDAHGSVSRRHAAICARSLTWLVQDLNSANGTFVNGERVQGERVLRHRDRIQLAQGGPEFQFELEPVSLPNIPVQPVVTQETIDEGNYRIEISPTRLMIQRKNGWLSIWGFPLGLLIMSFFFLPLLPLALMIGLLAVCLQTWDRSYTFDLTTAQLTLSRVSVLDVLLRRRRDRHYPLQNFTAVRLQKSAYEGDEGTRYDDYAIWLDRETGKPLKLAFNWRQNSGNAEVDKAQEVVEIIEQFLTQL
jgi:pSer/pThr/pTyr-binding forkhead associated (FHA) protein